MGNIKHNKWLLVFLLIYYQHSFALASDKHQPLLIHAQQATLNNKTGIAIFQGNVRLRQGSTKAFGNKLIAKLNANHQIIQTSLFGTLAHYSTIPNVNRPRLYTQAHKIIFHHQAQLIELIQQAQATQAQRIIQADKLTYNLSKQFMLSKAKKDHFVTMVFPPAKTSQ